ncbi:hypothetical protein MA16_Dca012132 [Dendrobium catenatum]|uniref:Uncharacterized protein n=1 Tax=Dendrobium catenatum TaxID=906689 RepID=A0A2I0VF72_9ASPA|nr:hypothetical protein MA16_Dca012132 [Dendrobium catenatum]
MVLSTTHKEKSTSSVLLSTNRIESTTTRWKVTSTASFTASPRRLRFNNPEHLGFSSDDPLLLHRRLPSLGSKPLVLLPS